VFVVKSVQDRASDDLKLAGRTGAGGVAKAGRQNADQEDRTQGQIGPGSVVVGHPRYQDSPQVPFAQWNDAVQTLPPQGSDKPFAKRVRLGLRTGAVITSGTTSNEPGRARSATLSNSPDLKAPLQRPRLGSILKPRQSVIKSIEEKDGYDGVWAG